MNQTAGFILRLPRSDNQCNENETPPRGGRGGRGIGGMAGGGRVGGGTGHGCIIGPGFRLSN